VSVVARIQGRQEPPAARSSQANRSAVERLEPALKELRILAEQVLSHRREIMVRWYDLYAMCGLSGSLRKDDFSHLLGDVIAHSKDDLLRGDLESYVCDVRRLGKFLYGHKLSLTQAVTLNHLLQASVSRALGNVPISSAAYDAFETLGVVRGLLIAERYLSASIDSDGKASEQNQRVRA